MQKFFQIKKPKIGMVFAQNNAIIFSWKYIDYSVNDHEMIVYVYILEKA